jgi:hypothetical protein
MNRKLVFVFFLIFTSIFLVVYSVSTTAAPPPPNESEPEKERDKIKESVLQAVDDQREYVLGYLLNDISISDIQLTQDGNAGIIYLEMLDQETGEVLPTEPGLAFAIRVDNGWEVILPSDPEWIEYLQEAPPELLSTKSKNSYTEMYLSEIQSVEATYSGYLLPWDAGKTVYLSQSTGHDKYIPSGSAHYSFDFYISKTMYQIRASKAGTVWRTRWDVPNGNDDDMGNYIVLKDETTSPTTYQLYLHLAKDSIPPDLRTVGTYIPQGQAIGIADDTGQSTGHHLHFHVHTNPNSYWGTSVDITFKDVDINGGRPRRESDLEYCTRPGDKCNQFRNNYISANVAPGDSTPPIGDLFQPVIGSIENSGSVLIDGWAFDDESGVSASMLMAYFNNSWQETGLEFTGTTFSGTWNMCNLNVPDGPVSLALKIRDQAGNYSTGLPGLTHIIKSYNCSQTVIPCTPGPNQISVHTSSDFQGFCRLFDVGEYSEISPTYDINIESIQTGSNVVAEVFGEKNFSGRSESIQRNDSNLADNLIQGDQIRSLKVTPKSGPAIAPHLHTYPAPGSQFTAGASISFGWRSAGLGNEFQVLITGPSGEIYSEWLPAPYWIADNKYFSEGMYSWKVRSRKCQENVCESPWSQASTFEVSAAPSPLLATTAPFSDSLEYGTGNWSATGLWNLLLDSTRAHSLNNAWYYGNPTNFNYESSSPTSGQLTSKPILVPDNSYQLSFWYRYETEDLGTHWDQRWVQISTDGAPFVNVFQLKNDVTNYWLRVKLDLTPYAGKEIQIRFFFLTLDSIKNSLYEGWLIDDIEIMQSAQSACNDGNNAPTNAQLLVYNQTLNNEICPSGDIDYFKFEGTAGDRVVLDIDTPSINPVENLDLILFLLDGDQRSVLAQHDDEILGTVFDPHLGYQIKRNGTYYVRTHLWANPTHGGENFDYQITLTKDNIPPQAEFTEPLSNTFINNTLEFDITLNATDGESGLHQVEFFYHSGDWLNENWQQVGVDQDGSNGWGVTLNTAEFPEHTGAAFFAKVYDWAGNITGTGEWEIGFDRTAPVSSLQALEQVQASTAIHLRWSGSDNISGVALYQLQMQENYGNWTNISPSPSGDQQNFWFIGNPSTSYNFRIRAVDAAGNIEIFPVSPEASTVIPDPAVFCSSPDDWDKAGNDNSPQNSTQLDLSALPTLHNFCNPLSSTRLYDEDWVNFEVEIGQPYLMETQPTGVMAGSIIELYEADGSTLLASSQPDQIGGFSRIIWTSDRTGKVFLRVRHLDGRIAGNIVSYQLKVNNFLPIFIPLIHR